MKVCLFLLKIFVCLLFIIHIECSLEYVSLKKLCHYDDPTVSELVQKKIYAILSPLFSQKPWQGKNSEPKISHKDYSKLQAIIYALNLHTFPKELIFKIFGQGVFAMRQYKSFRSQAQFIPFLQEDTVWALQDEHAELKRHVGYKSYWNGIEWVDFTPSDFIRLSVYEGFNFKTFPTAILKLKENGIIVCLFEYGSISIVDLNQMKEIWRRKYRVESVDFEYNNLIYDDNYGHVITGYNDVVCFLDRDNNRFKFYTVSDLVDQKSYSYEIQNKKNNHKFQMMHTQDFGSPHAMNSNYFFYAFFKKRLSQNGPYSYWSYSPIENNSASHELYYVSYRGEPKEEKIFYQLKNEKGFFNYLTCNDTCLIARDNNNKLYVWNLTDGLHVLPHIIEKADNLVSGDFWLDNCSLKILTQSGVFKIQDVFKDLPRVPPIQLKQIIESPKSLEEENSKIPEEPFNRKYGFFRKLCMQIYELITCLYWAIKEEIYIFLYFLGIGQ